MISHSITGVFSFIQTNKKFLIFLCICYIIGAEESMSAQKVEDASHGAEGACKRRIV